MTTEKKEVWSMEELVALTDEVQISEVIFRDKLVEFQFCERRTQNKISRGYVRGRENGILSGIGLRTSFKNGRKGTGQES